MKNFATHVVTRVEQQLQHGRNAQDLKQQRVEQHLGHGLSKYNGKSCSACCRQRLTIAGALSLLVLWKTMLHLLSWELKHLGHFLFLFYEKPCSACCHEV